MKKYLINGAMALIVGGFIVSCSHDDISQTATVDQMTKSFNEMFTELYGPIAPNHNWGFETIAAEEGEDEATETEAAGTRALTRAGGVGEVIKPDNGKDGIFEFTNDEKNAKVYQNTWRPLQMMREIGFKHGLIILIIEVCLRKAENFTISMFSKYTTNSILMRKTIKMDISGK